MFSTDKNVSKRNVPIVTFRSLEGLEWLGCGFSTRFGGVSKGCFSSMNMNFNRGDNCEDVLQNIRIFGEEAGFLPEDVVMPHQCHTTNVQVVGRNDCGRGVSKPGTEEEVDGQITNERGVVLFCFGADCVPVFLVDTKKRVVSAVHAGWRGTIGDIIGNAIGKMIKEFGCGPKNIKAVIGPSICRKCYEVSGDVAEAFLKRYGYGGFSKEIEHRSEHAADILENKGSNVVFPASGSLKDNPTGKFFIDLWEANRINLMRAGVSPENIEVCGICTKCNPDRFFSHRVHGNDRGVNTGYIFIKQ